MTSAVRRASLSELIINLYNNNNNNNNNSRGSLVGMATGYGVDDPRSIPGSGAHPASYPVCSGVSFTGGIAARA
jgi:hypothetical protein